jgi:hypothetical protein
MRVPDPNPPPTESERLRPVPPAALQEWDSWSREGFLTDSQLRNEAMSRVDVTELTALFAHLEPIPSQVWVSAVQACLGEPTTPHSGRIECARKSWLEGYAQLRQLHSDEDKRISKLDWRQSKPPHPAIWRIPEWRALADKFRSAAAELQPMKAHKRGVVTRIPSPSGGFLVLKHFPPHKKIDPRNAMGYSKAIASLHAADALNRRGLRAAYGFAAWSEPGNGSWMLMENLESHQALQTAVVEKQGLERAELLAALARFARRMHLLGVAYRDFKPSNILVDLDAWPTVEFVLIDHDRNRFHNSEIAPPRARRDLAALHAGLPPEVRAAERLQALRIYGGPWRKHTCNWGYRGTLWEQQIPKLIQEAKQRDRVWKSHRLLEGH